LELISLSTCSAYDCEFVALAKEQEIRLVTFDSKIIREFPGIAIQATDFIAKYKK
jgi:predicted nucleic acid-binding protein